jgi:hypothetical protein
MIKGITGGAGLIVGGGTTNLPYVPTNPSNPIQGMIRVNNSDVQVFDGSTWVTMGASYATVELDANTQSLLKWVEAQRTMAFNRMEAVRQNPALSKAFEAIAKAEANFDILAKFVEHDHDSVQSSP